MSGAITSQEIPAEIVIPVIENSLPEVSHQPKHEVQIVDGS